MRVHVRQAVDDDEARAIARALAEHLGEPVAVVVGDDDEPTARVEPPAGTDEAPAGAVDDASDEGGSPGDGRAGAGPTDRERRLRAQIDDILDGGPRTYRDRLDEQGKLFVRDRLELWFGDLAFEDGRFAAFDEWHPDAPGRGQEGIDEGDGEAGDDGADDGDRLPADGMVTGAAAFEDREVHVMANDYTVKAGSMARRGVEKFLRLQDRAMKTGKPVLYLMDSSGGRIDRQSSFFANREGIGKYYYNHSLLSGRVPQICVLYGPCIAGAAYTPVFADFTVMVEGMSAMAIASPRMVEMVTGEEISLDELGGPEVHARHTGSADLVAADEVEARDLVADLLSYLPDRAGERPPGAEPRDPAASPAGIDALIPESPREAYDVHDLIERVVDADSFFELKPAYGREIVTGFARVDGRAVGVVANQPARRAGAIFPDSAEKAAEFVWTCDAYEVPLLYLCDTPGFMAGRDVERAGILEAGKKFIYATASATVPKQTVVTRKAYGAGIYAMGGPAYDPESVLALPSGEIAIMGPEAAINAVYANELADIDDEEERARREAELREAYRRGIDVRRAASEVVVDEVVPPSDLRAELAARFAFYESVEKDRPEKKHGTIL